MVKHLISSFFTRAIVAGINFAALLFSSHFLGSAVVGQVSLLILNIAIIQTVNEIYTGSSLAYFIPQSRFKTIYAQGSLFVLSGSAITGLVFLLIRETTLPDLIHLFLLSVIISLNAFQNMILLIWEKISTYNLLLLFQPLLLLVTLLVCIFIFKKRSFDSYLISLYVSFGTFAMISAAFVWKYHRRKTGQTSPGIYNIIRNGIQNQLGNLAHTLSNRLNYYILAVPALVGVYASSTSLIESLWIISAGVSPLVLTQAANRRNPQQLAIRTLVLARWCFLAASACVLVIWLLPQSFFIYLLGKDFTETKTVMLRLSPGVVLVAFSSIISHYFSGQGKQKILLSANLTGLLFTLILAWPFINTWGIYGACYAAALAYAAQAIVLTITFFRDNNLPFRKLLSDWKGLKFIKDEG